MPGIRLAQRSDDDLPEQLQALRARVAQLERALESGIDPILRSLMEHAADYLNVIDLDGRTLATGRTSAAFGSVVGRSIFDFVEPQYVPIMRAAFAQVIATARPSTFESVGFGEDGSLGHSYITRVVPLMDGDSVSALVLVHTDITERVRLEHSLTEQKEALRLAVDASRMGMWSWDVASNVISWDARMLEIFGLTEAPCDYAAYLELLHPDDRARVDGYVRAAVTTGEFPTLFEHRAAAREGYAEHWLLAAGSVMRDEQGQPVKLMGGALDITEQKHMAERLARTERVEHIGQLTAGIAHNFNNLLAAILPNLELALVNAGAVQQGPLQAALDASVQAREVVRNLMSLTERGDDRTLQPAHPSQVIPRVQSICRVTFPREIELSHTIEPGVGHVTLSVGDLEQILLNLLFNARDAIAAAPGTGHNIEIRVSRVLDARGAHWVEVSVRDTGIGMPESVKARVFEAFFTTKPPHKGSGLGLAYAAARVRDAGGAMDCQTELGAGSTFTFRVPERAHAEAPAPTVVDHPAPRATILLVDDEPMVRSVVGQLLQREGHEVFGTESAAGARELLKQHGARIDLVILDASMPHESGLEALPSLRALTRAPVVLFTGMAASVPEGIAAVLEKPARAAELRRLIRETLHPHGT